MPRGGGQHSVSELRLHNMVISRQICFSYYFSNVNVINLFNIVACFNIISFLSPQCPSLEETSIISFLGVPSKKHQRGCIFRISRARLPSLDGVLLEQCVRAPVFHLCTNPVHCQTFSFASCIGEKLFFSA